jgi:hypothetical protein
MEVELLSRLYRAGFKILYLGVQLLAPYLSGKNPVVVIRSDEAKHCHRRLWYERRNSVPICGGIGP